jgi:lactoylglutathione lyase
MSPRKPSRRPAAKRAAARKPARKASPKGSRTPSPKPSAKPSRKPAARKRAGHAARKTAQRTPSLRERIVRARPETLRLRSITPSLTVDDLDRSLTFYTRGLGFVVAEVWERDGRRTGALLRAGACELSLAQDDWAKGRDRKKGLGARLYLETVQDVDALSERAPAAGGELTSEPKANSWGAYAFAIDDPDGYHLTIYKRLPAN